MEHRNAALSLAVEPLEDRRLLAGNVSAQAVGSLLTIQGDSLGNDIVIEQLGGALQITSGTDPTTVFTQGDLSRVTRIKFDDPGGSDSLTLRNLHGLNSVRLTFLGGQDQIHLEDAQLGRMDVVFNDGTLLDLHIEDSTISRNTRLEVSNASLATEIHGNSQLEGNLWSRVAGGDHHLHLADSSTIGRSLRQVTSGGDSTTELTDQVVIGSVVLVRNADGQSEVQIVDDVSMRRFVGSGYTREANLAYVDRNGEPVRADLYLPRSDGPHPAVIAIHGGAWRAGSKAGMRAEARELAQRGYVVMSIDYRLAPAHPFPAQIHDVKAAITWLKENAAQFDVDPDRIGLWGFSAGGHLALLAGLTGPADGLEDPSIPIGGATTSVQAIVASAPPTDFRDVELHSTEFVYLFGGTRAEVPELYQQASPASWVSADDPPVHVYIGENDRLVSTSKAQQLVTDLENVGVDADLEILPSKNHLTAKTYRPAVYTSLRFLDTQLKV